MLVTPVLKLILYNQRTYLHSIPKLSLLLVIQVVWLTLYNRRTFYHSI